MNLLLMHDYTYVKLNYNLQSGMESGQSLRCILSERLLRIIFVLLKA